MAKAGGNFIRPYFSSFLIGLIALFESCGARTEPTRGNTGSRVVEIKHPYEMDADQRKKLCDKVASLRQGDSYAEVVKLLGAPTTEDLIMSYPLKEPGPPRGVRLEYYIRRLHSDANERDDQSIELDFDNNRKLTYIATRNLQELFKRLTRVNALQTYWDESKIDHLIWETRELPSAAQESR